jgi:hypothetical protein
MILTELEAKEKWCPMITENNRAARLSPKDNFYVCCASACMMWRWERDRYAEGYELKPDHEDYNKGYCGLAGG